MARIRGGSVRHPSGRSLYLAAAPGGWATDPGELAAAIGPQTAAVLLMSPAMPTGAVLSGEHFDAIADPVNRYGAWVIWDAAMVTCAPASMPRWPEPSVPPECARRQGDRYRRPDRQRHGVTDRERHPVLQDVAQAGGERAGGQ